jgi:hypothetical protein
MLPQKIKTGAASGHRSFSVSPDRMDDMAATLHLMIVP